LVHKGHFGCGVQVPYLGCVTLNPKPPQMPLIHDHSLFGAPASKEKVNEGLL